eukprot:CAMPEP_0194600728 /NCGR_PEP_ID=MMETSP0292-20121207/28535_1 /TAXON_ID=39354 /ORGANISM="Heterosigma akashiwo, Strain CCMP2393" /LENGTH=313 /DNA_ID=CAMNT_0039462451 /DNA_START=3 /DNA_END=941 /DNA_ORIENTATION=-
MIRASEKWKRLALEMFSETVFWDGNFHKYAHFWKHAVPWGFVSQQAVKDSILPMRQALKEMDRIRTTEDRPGFLVPFLGCRHYPEAWVQQVQDFDVSGMQKGLEQMYRHLVSEFNQGRNFYRTDICSPMMSRYLTTVNRTLHCVHKLEPRVIVHKVKPTVCGMWIERDHVAKNRHFLGLMSPDEARWHLRMGMAGPETAQPLERVHGQGPRRLVAEVKFEVEESVGFVDVTEDERDISEKRTMPHLTEGKQQPTGNSIQLEKDDLAIEKGVDGVFAAEKRVHFFTIETNWYSPNYLLGNQYQEYDDDGDAVEW